MKKSYLRTGIGYVSAGVLCLLIALLWETKLESLLWGFAGAGIFPGIQMIWRYCYWSAPQREQEYRERMEAESIDLHDERNEKLRDKAGRYAYLLGIIVASVSMLVFSILDQLEVIGDSRMIVLYLFVFLLVEIYGGAVILKYLAKKY